MKLSNFIVKIVFANEMGKEAFSKDKLLVTELVESGGGKKIYGGCEVD